MEQAIVHRSAVAREVQLYTPVRRVLQVSAIPLDVGVESAGAVAYVTDVTEQRRVEEMRRDFVANVGHELKTPLGALAVLAETLAGGIADGEVSLKLAGRVEEESRRLSRLLDDILDLSQAEAMSSRFRPVDVGDVVTDVAGMLGESAKEHDVDLEVAPVPPGAVVAGDGRQLRSLVTNLVDNATKYSDGGRGASAPVVAVRVRLQGDEVVLEVEDQGIGIHESHIRRIFERFYRVDRARSRATGGTGLGLSIVRNVAAGHGGSVSVVSEVGVGSTFTVRLPRWSGS
jgi:two-component system sensor histidine kinase SenX3